MLLLQANDIDYQKIIEMYPMLRYIYTYTNKPIS